jgi:CO dehydrogenase/acetyl-CoA synthase epsilon subunit
MRDVNCSLVFKALQIACEKHRMKIGQVLDNVIEKDNLNLSIISNRELKERIWDFIENFVSE